jgi:hypothetical protein
VIQPVSSFVDLISILFRGRDGFCSVEAAVSIFGSDFAYFLRRGVSGAPALVIPEFYIGTKLYSVSLAD